MDVQSIVYSALSIGGLGLVFGLGLGVAAKVFEVKVDPLVPIVREALPGANCGACGYAGCDAYAKAVVEEGAAVTCCPVGGASLVVELSKIMGVEAVVVAKQVAYVKCQGNCERAVEKYEYNGVMDCKNANFLQGKGSKGCEFGCLGLGSCVRACEYGAIDIVDGIAVINKDKCVACGLCVLECPKNIIEMVPDDKKVRVACASLDKGKDAKSNCSTACIACKMCEKACEYDAIKVVNNIAKIDYDKCTQCDACVEKCPTKAILHL
jgi:Na+-translocating ferredoxin:NAD+ oxidoreductase RNF subunit RnfB